jgi:hypothetical protein
MSCGAGQRFSCFGVSCFVCYVAGWPPCLCGVWCVCDSVRVVCSQSHTAGAGCPQAGFSALRYVRRDFRKKKSGPRTPRPGAPPVLGFLVRSAEGLPSTRNWPFRWSLPPATHQPAPGDTQGNASRQLAGAVVLGGGAAPAPPLAAAGASVLLPLECLGKTRGVQAFGGCPRRPGQDGWAKAARCPREGRRSKAAASW